MKGMKIMRKINFIVLSFILVICGLSVLITQANETSYQVVWNTDNLETGIFSSYNGLSSVAANELSVVETQRTYENVTYSKAIKTNGSANVSSAYVPSKRAFKFTTEQPCFVRLLAYGTSSNTSTQPIFVSKSGKLIAEFDLRHNSLTENIVFLDSVGTYYVYCTTGSFGVCYMDLNLIYGNINGDGDIDKDDLTVLYQMMYAPDNFNSDVLEFADLNSDGTIDNEDVGILENLINVEGNYVPKYFKNKTWNMDDYSTNTRFTGNSDLDGMLVVCSSTDKNVTSKIDAVMSKSFNENKFTNFLSTGGLSSFNVYDKTLMSRGIKIFTSEPCYLTLLVRVGNSNSAPTLTVSKKGEIVSETALLSQSEQNSNGLQYINIYLDEPNEYGIGCKTGSIHIYFVDLNENKRRHIDLTNETVWNFSDQTFVDNYTKNGVLYGTVNNLNILVGVTYHIDDTENTIRGEKYKDYILLGTASNYKMQKSVSFYAESGKKIYVVGRSNDGVSDRKLSLYSEGDNSVQTLTVNSADAYCFTVKKSGNVYLYSSDNVVRVYCIYMKETNAEHFSNLDDVQRWDFSESDIRGTIAHNMEYNGMQIYANSTNSVPVAYNNVYTPEGFVYYYYLSLQGAGCNDYMSVSFDVAKNSYVYITARVPSDNTERQLIVTNKYSGELSTDLTDSRITVDDKTRVYRFKYTGNGEKIYLRSQSGQIRLYQVVVRRMTSTKYNETDYNFNEMEAGSKITSFDDGNFHISASSSYPATVTADKYGEYTNALGIWPSNFMSAGKIYFPVTNCASELGAKMHTISVTAKGSGQKLYLANEYGYVYKIFELTDEPEKYYYNYRDSSEMLYLYSYSVGNGYVYIYNVMSGDFDYNDTSGSNKSSVSFSEGDIFNYHFTCENIPSMDLYDYYISYDSSLLKIKSITFGPDLDDFSSSINVSYETDSAVFEINDTSLTNWSGVIATVTFEALSDGKSSIGFDVYRKSGEV